MAKGPQTATAPPVIEQVQAPPIQAAFPTIDQGNLMKSLAASNGAYLSQEAGQSLIDNGWASVDINNQNENGAFVTLTDTGSALVAGASTAPAIAVKPAGAITIQKGVPMPTKGRRGRGGSMYPLDEMEVGDSFHVVASAADDDVFARVSSTVANARSRYSVAVPNQTETVKVIDWQKDAAGKRMKGPEGKWVKLGEHEETRGKTELTRDFTVSSVDATDPNGVGVRVWRTK